MGSNPTPSADGAIPSVLPGRTGQPSRAPRGVPAVHADGSSRQPRWDPRSRLLGQAGVGLGRRPPEEGRGRRGLAVPDVGPDQGGLAGGRLIGVGRRIRQPTGRMLRRSGHVGDACRQDVLKGRHADGHLGRVGGRQGDCGGNVLPLTGSCYASTRPTRGWTGGGPTPSPRPHGWDRWRKIRGSGPSGDQVETPGRRSPTQRAGG